MPEKIDLPKSIPIFPLPKAVLLPRSRLPLHIFEPRYFASARGLGPKEGRMGLTWDATLIYALKAK